MSNTAFTAAATTGTVLNGSSLSAISANTVSDSISGLPSFSVTDYLPENAINIGDSLYMNSNGEAFIYCDKEKSSIGERDVKKKTRYFAIIGANYGDEGKGYVTQRLCQENKGMNLCYLYNGGMQRGHTVVNEKDNKRHVFHCFGSGTFTGAATYWGSDFLVDPEAVLLEKEELGFMPQVYCWTNCFIVTPYDIMLNRVKESLRGNLNHGSCGMGIYETIVRSKTIPIFAHELNDMWTISTKMAKIRDYYWEQYKQLGLSNEPPEVSLELFYRGIALINEKVTISNKNILDIEWDNVFFEGGQGLALSQKNKDDMPFLTPSYTGSENIVKAIGNNPIKVHYVTRPYLTRHGAGPLPDEDFEIAQLVSCDQTNVPNDWQGTLRYAPLNVEDMKKRIEEDLKCYKKRPWMCLYMTDSEDGRALVQTDEVRSASDAKYPHMNIEQDIAGLIDEYRFSRN